jgi:hypothetical protein
MSQTARRSRKPPSRTRYEASHPVVSARLSREDRDKLKEMLGSTEKSLARFIREAIGSTRADYDKAYDLGYRKGKEDHQVWYFCNRCGGRMDIRPNSPNHEALIQSLRARGRGHTSCHKSMQAKTTVNVRPQESSRPLER